MLESQGIEITYQEIKMFIGVVVTGLYLAVSGLTTVSMLSFIAAVTFWIFNGGSNTLYLIYHTLPRDLRAAKFCVQFMVLVKWSQLVNWTVPKMFLKTANKMPDKIMFYFEDQTWTFRQVDEYSNKIANTFMELGYVKGDSVALYMENRPEYVSIWLGLAKIGVVPALLNHNQKKAAFLHAVKVVGSTSIIFGAELAEDAKDLLEIPEARELDLKFFCSGLNYVPSARQIADEINNCKMLDEMLTKASAKEVPKKILDSLNFSDKLLYIFTSGTTGLPKAAVIKHSRYILASGGSRYIAGIRGNDVVYSPLPLYHSVAGMVTISGSFSYGFSCALRRKFSASCFWKDCVKYNVTVGQYIGEICRYLLNTPECPEEKQHKIRLMFGNGLRPQVWRQFVDRFNVPNIAEFYGSTEGNSNIVNRENITGAVGFVSVLFPKLFPLGLIKFNRETGEAVRGEDGLCVRCEPGEPGEFVGQIVHNHPVRDFHGYVDKKATEKKILRDVWKKGDLCFRSGDILVMDRLGWLYFKDRAGDTFRWRGENVSTAEVEATISNMIHLRDAAVYGVKIPGTEGSAGMAAIHDPEGEVDLAELSKGVIEELPSFARPLFVRLVKRLDLTGTFKLKKFNLQKEGYDISEIDKTGSTDKLFFLHPKTGTYEPLTMDLFNNIVNGLIRL